MSQLQLKHKSVDLGIKYCKMTFEIFVRKSYLCVSQMLAEKVHIKALTIAQRVQLLQDGLNDRSGKVFIFQINFSVALR